MMGSTNQKNKYIDQNHGNLDDPEFLGGRYRIRRGSSIIWQKKKYTLDLEKNLSRLNDAILVKKTSMGWTRTKSKI